MRQMNNRADFILTKNTFIASLSAIIADIKRNLFSGDRLNFVLYVSSNYTELSAIHDFVSAVDKLDGGMRADISVPPVTSIFIAVLSSPIIL